MAVFAMLLQAVFAAEHISAMSVASARGAADGLPLGFLELCTARGFTPLTRTGQPGSDLPAPTSPGGSGKTCVLCGSASVAGAVAAPEAGIVPLPPSTFACSLSRPAHEAPFSQPRFALVPIRAPPAFSSI
ncbi:MAG: hypothetical protein C0606_08630 [Hyphomicrobiales bacterium]|nr:MAG: hypothetical protein C0606_08630 [Hyphomicrobiales bacterium]